MMCIDCGVEIFGKRSKQRCESCSKKRLSYQQKQWRENKDRPKIMHRAQPNSLTYKIYTILKSGDKSLWELAHIINESQSIVNNGVTNATYIYPDIYSYSVRRNGKSAEIIGLTSNYKGKTNGQQHSNTL